METVMLFSLVTSILMECYKWLIGKYGKEATRRSIYLGVFALSLFWTLLKQADLISFEAVQAFSQMMLYSVGTYELIIKTIKRVLSQQE